MKMLIRNNKDFWAGMLLIGVGGVAMYIARDYQYGSALKMGPGFFPTMLSAVLIGFGICIMAIGLYKKEKIRGHLSLRAVTLLSLSLVLFGILMNHAGFIPALMVLILVSSIARRGFKLVEVLLMSVFLTVLATAVFIFGLQLPFPLFGKF